MYNLRSRSDSNLTQPDDDKEHVSEKKRKNTRDNNLINKRIKLSEQKHEKTKIIKKSFDPKFFKKGSSYTDICDSSDSDSTNESEHVLQRPKKYGNESIKLDDDGCEEESFSPDDEYFDIDKAPLISIITKSINNKFPNLDNKSLENTITKAINNAESSLVEEYCGVVPKDASWKAELDPNDARRLKPQLKQLRENIKENTPTLPKILQSGLSTLEKERAVELYDMLNNTEPYTLTYINLRTKISTMIRTAPTKSDENNDIMYKKLLDKANEQIPTAERILAAYIPETDKIRALQLYDSLQRKPFDSEDYLGVQRTITTILDGKLESKYDVECMEAEEETLKQYKQCFDANLKREIFRLDADPDIKGRIYEMYCDMISKDVSDNKYSDLKDKILWAIKLPYRRKAIPKLMDNTPEGIRSYCQDAYQRLDTEIYGMKEAKMKIIQTLNDRIYNPESRALLALKGKPGVGKTKLASVIAKVAGKAFDKISLGGAIDSTIFKGSDNVWGGSSPSLLLQILSRKTHSDIVLLLDELDKLACTDKGIEVENSLLHILDQSQNKAFQDSFLCEFTHDISNIWFIIAINDDTKISPALRDRLNIIDIPTYTADEMVQIIKLHTLPEALVDKGIPKENIAITNDGAHQLLRKLGNQISDSGMRPVEKAIGDIVSKLNFLRTMYVDGVISSNIPLTYKLKDFHGFPYVITSESVDALVTPSKNITNLSYYM